MSTAPTPAEPTNPNPTPNPEPQPGAMPDEQLGEKGLAALQSEREARKNAEKAAAAALAKVKQFEDAQKSEAEKQADRLAEIERENAELKAAKTRAEVAAAKGVPAELLTGSTQAELEASAEALIKFKGEQQPQRLIVPGEGNQPNIPLNGDGLEAALKQALGIE